jgi:hypothetical protein
MLEATVEKINGKKCIKIGAFTYVNTKYHKPYLAVLSPDGEHIFQDREYVGYGKGAEVYYSVENLKVGDYLKTAGGSGNNKYPFTGRVVEISDTEIKVEEVGYIDFNNIVADRKSDTGTTFNLVSTIEFQKKDFDGMFSLDMQHIVLSRSKKILNNDVLVAYIIEVGALGESADMVDEPESDRKVVEKIINTGAKYIMVRSV